jgi:hypothetical protein
MNGAVELWSEPWHELQRRLARVLCAPPSGGDLPYGLMPESKAKAHPGMVPPSGSWMVRAHSRRGQEWLPAAR